MKFSSDGGTATATNGKAKGKARLKATRTDLGAYLEERVYPALYDRLDSAFPEFAFRSSGSDKQVATDFPLDLPYAVESKKPDRLVCYADRPWQFMIHGHGPMRWLDYVNRGRKPRGDDFLAACRTLCDKAGVPFPERQMTAEEREQARRWEERRTVLSVVLETCQAIFWSEAGEPARSYMHGRGFTDEDLKGLGVGLYRSADEMRAALKAARCDIQAADDASLIWPKMEGYAVLPWPDATGGILTLYGRWPGDPPEDKPKTLALPGDGTKGVPLFFDRARKAGHKDIVAVEGLFDAALLQCRGDDRVVAYVAASFSAGQVETLKRYNIASVIICPDPDGGGDKGAENSVKRLAEAGIAPYVAPRLPDGLDPDEFLIREGIDGWKAHVADPMPGAVYRALRMFGDITPSSPEIARRKATDGVLEYVRTLHDERDRTAVLKLIVERTGFRIADLKKRARPTGKDGGGRARGEGGSPYSERDGCLVFEDPSQDPPARIALTNFSARIVAQIERHEQGEVRRQYRIEAVHSDGQAGGAVVDAEDYESMGWVASQLGGEWILSAGRGMKDHARAAIQALSHRDGIGRMVVHTSTGWVRRGGRWLYLHAGGAIDAGGVAEGVTVDVGRALARYALPDPPDADALRKGVDACLRILDLAKARRPNAPAVAAVLASLPWRAALGPSDFSVHFSGTTGDYKTSAARLAYQHFAARITRRDKLPASWSSTLASLQCHAFDCKDSLLVIDELTGENAVAVATEFFQCQGNLKGRDRMDKDRRLAPSLDPRGSVLSTGEADPTRQSSLSRMLTVRFTPATIDFGTLKACQADAAANLYALTMSAFLCWLAEGDRLDVAKREHVGAVDRIAERIGKALEGVKVHPRHPECAAEMLAGYRLFLRFAVERGTILEGTAEGYAAAVERYFITLLREQGEIQQEANPAQRALALLRAGLSLKRLILHDANSDGAPSPYEAACGWHKDFLYDGENKGQYLDWKPPVNSKRVGYIDVGAGIVYLNFEQMEIAVQEMARGQGERFENISKLRREMADAGLLLSVTEGGKVRYALQKRIPGEASKRWPAIRVRDLFGLDPEDIGSDANA